LVTTVYVVERNAMGALVEVDVVLMDRILDISHERASMEYSARLLMAAERERIIDINA
jgi:hypothetical protein